MAGTKTKTTAAAKKTTTKKTTAAKKPAAKKTTTAATPITAAPVVAAPVAATPVADAPIVKTPVQLVEEQFISINQQILNAKNFFTQLSGDVKRLQKDMVRLAKKSTGRKKRVLTEEEKKNRAPSGFAKPSLISDELCKFLGKEIGSEMARTEVTKFLSCYIKEHSLQDPANKRRINPDKKLGKLLNVQKNDEVTYFNLQKYMKVHFTKAPAVVPAAATTVTATA